MSGAQSWSVKGIDPKVREAAREAAARQGMTLGEYLNQALQNHQPPGPPSGLGGAQRLRARVTPHPYDEEDAWPAMRSEPAPRPLDPTRLAQRIDSIERRTQLAITGLDRAVSTMDRSVLGLAARVEEAEAVSQESAERIGEALEQFRLAGETLSGRLQSTEHEIAESREALDGAKYELSTARERLEIQVAAAEEIARRAEAAAEFLATEMNNREAALDHKLGLFEDKTHDALVEARAAAEHAAKQAAEAASDALAELRQLSARFDHAVQDSRAEQAILAERLAHETQAAKAAAINEVNARIGTVETLKTEQAALINRIEKAEANSRESTAGLRQAAGAAIADLRNAQLGLAARLKQVEDGAGRAGALDIADLRVQQAEIASRLAALETKPSNVDSALARFEQRLQEIAQRTDAKPGQDAFAAFEQRLQDIASRQGGVSQDKLDEVGASVKTLDANLQRLADRLAETESTANNAIRTLEQTVSGLSEKVAGVTALQETEALRAMLEQRLDDMAHSVSTMVGEARTEIAGQVQSVLEGGADGEGFEGALADVNRRLAAAERRQAQTIEAISIEIKRMSETVDRRLRAVEDNTGGDAAGVTVREELARMAQTLEARFEEIERREAAGFDRMGLEVGRLSERLEERVGAVEVRSAQAIEHVGEQVARMAERFNQRHEILARDLGERMLDSEERSGARVSEAISSIMQRLGEVEERSAEAVAPVQKAVSSIASRLDGLAKDDDEDEIVHDIPTPARRIDDLVGSSPFSDDPFEDESFEAPSSYAPSPMDTAQPMRAGPLPPLSAKSSVEPIEDDIYFAEDIEPTPLSRAPEPAPAVAPLPETKSYLTVEADAEPLAFEDALLEEQDAFAPPPPEDDDPFWAPDAAGAAEAPLAITPESHDIDADAEAPPPIEEPAEPAPPPGRHDYLKSARKAAQDQSLPQKAREPATPTYSLRGSSRIVLWGAASAIALLIAGGAWYLNAQDHARRAAPSQPEPDVTPPTQALPPPATPYDQNAAPTDTTTATTDATAPGDPAAAPSAATVAPAPAPAASQPPIAQAAPATRAAAATQTVAAGPLPRRNVSLEQAAQSGDLVAEYELALQRIAAGRGQDGMTLLHRAADHGMPMAQYRLAKIYERGEGVPIDLTQARQWTERAAAGGNRRAMHDLGVYYARGEGAALDEQAAYRWFRQAAELGVTDSQYNLGVLYQQGRGVAASPAEALFWFLVAARQGDSDASARATALESQLQQPQVDQAQARAEAFRPRAVSGPANGEFGPRPWSTAPAAPGA